MTANNPYVTGELADQTCTGAVFSSFTFNTAAFSSCDFYWVTQNDGSSIPTWLVPNIGGSHNNTFSCINPSSIATYTIKVTCIDSIRNTANLTFSLTVSNNVPVASSAIGTKTAYPAEQFKLRFRETYTDADEAGTNAQWMTFSIAETLQSWMNLDSNRGYLIANAPTSAAGSTYTYTLSATDTLQTVTESFSIKVNQRPSYSTNFYTSYTDY